jgi:hypothetical protein
MKYEDIKHMRISDLNEDDFKIWIMDELTDLMNDCGQKIDNDMLIHSVRRLRGVLFLGKYRSWYVGDVHATFQVGLSGAYGMFTKVTVKSLLQFLNQAQRQLTNKNVNKAEEESDRKNAAFSPRITFVSDFIIWATTNQICLEYLNPGYNPMVERKVSKEVEAMADDYHTAKDLGVLHSFKNRIKNDSMAYFEKIK